MDHVLMSNLPELADNKMSRQQSEYYLNAVNMRPNRIPTFSYGMQQTRQAESPPESLIDTESRLNNRYDIIGKSGYVYRKDGESMEDHVSINIPQVRDSRTDENQIDSFFNQISGRDVENFGCSSPSFWRKDVLTVNKPVPTRYSHVDTRLQTKDKINDCREF